MSLDQVRALTFDVFGTVVDWRTSVIRQSAQHGARHGLSLDWDAFVDDWRYDGYMGGIRKVIDGDLPFQTADALHRRKLVQLLQAAGAELPDADIDAWNRAWHYLDPWPDSVGGLARLRARCIVSTLSNGNVALLVDMARHAALPWDCVLAADVTGAFKPQPQCYQRAAEILDLQPHQVMMVAAHKADLAAAARAGLRTAFVPRPLEAGPRRDVDLTPDPAFDIVATDFHHLADQLGCS